MHERKSDNEHLLSREKEGDSRIGVKNWYNLRRNFLFQEFQRPVISPLLLPTTVIRKMWKTIQNRPNGRKLWNKKGTYGESLGWIRLYQTDSYHGIELEGVHKPSLGINVHLRLSHTWNHSLRNFPEFSSWCIQTASKQLYLLFSDLQYVYGIGNREFVTFVVFHDFLQYIVVFCARERIGKIFLFSLIFKQISEFKKMKIVIHTGSHFWWHLLYYGMKCFSPPTTSSFRPIWFFRFSR